MKSKQAYTAASLESEYLYSPENSNYRRLKNYSQEYLKFCANFAENTENYPALQENKTFCKL